MAYSVIACITGRPEDDDVLFAARQKAGALGVPWCGVYIGEEEPGAESHQTSLAATKVRALGGDILQPPPAAIRDMPAFLRGIGETEGLGMHVFLAETTRFWGPVRLSGLGAANDFMTLHRIAAGGPKLNFWRWRQRFGGETVRELTRTVGYVAVVTLAIKLVAWLNPENIFLANASNVSIIYLIICMVASILHGLVPGLIACLLSLLTINFYFTSPGGGFYFSSLEEAFHAVLFLTAGTVIAVIGSGTRFNVLIMRQRERQLHALLSLSRTLSLPLTQPEALEHLLAELRELLHRDVLYFLPSPEDASRVGMQYPEGITLDPLSRKALDVCWLDYVPTGFGTAHVGESEWRFQPMLSNRGLGGAIGVHMVSIDASIDDDAFDQLLEGLADLSATILERIDITSMAEQTRVRAERDRMHTMMMSSVSHDLKTPLASVIGSLNAYRSMYGSLSEEHRKALTDTALEEAVRLDHFITNILDLAKLENNPGTFPLEMGDPLELVNLTVKRLGHRLQQHRLRIRCESPVEVMLSPGLTRQIIYHLLDNAAKYSPLGSIIQVEIECELESGELEIRVTDEGPGVEPAMQASIFNKYTRLKNTDRQIAGTGLGLAVSRLAAEAQGGSLSMENNPGGGAVFTFRLPHCQAAGSGKV